MSIKIFDVVIGKTIYEINGNKVWDIANSKTVYEINDNKVWDVANSKTVYEINGNKVWDIANSKTAYEINDNKVWDVANGKTVFEISGNNKIDIPSFSGGSASGGKSDEVSFTKVFLTNPIGLTILGLLIAIGLGSITEKAGIVIIGLIISVLGIFWFIKRKQNLKKFMDINLPNYLEFLEIFKQNGYEVREFSHKDNIVRTSVSINEKDVGETFFLAPPPNGIYAKFREVEKSRISNFSNNYYKKYKKAPEIPASIWPVNSLIGAFATHTATDLQEIKEWLTLVANILQDDGDE